MRSLLNERETPVPPHRHESVLAAIEHHDALRPVGMEKRRSAPGTIQGEFRVGH